MIHIGGIHYTINIRTYYRSIIDYKSLKILKQSRNITLRLINIELLKKYEEKKKDIYQKQHKDCMNG